MEKKYFIRSSVNNSPKNKLDEALHAAFKRVIDYVISKNNLPMLDAIFEETVQEYVASGGRCKPWKFSRMMPGATMYQNPDIYVQISESYSLYLSEIKGEIAPV